MKQIVWRSKHGVLRPICRHLVLAFALLFSSTGWSATPDDEQLSVTYTVQNGEGQPIEGANVTATGMRSVSSPLDYLPMPRPYQVVRSDASGRVTLSYPKYATEQLVTGKLALSIEAPGFSLVQNSYPVEAPKPIRLEKASTVVVQVVRDGALVHDLISIQGQGTEFLTRELWQPQSDGTYISTQIPPGKYMLRAVHLPQNRAPAWSKGTIIETAKGGTTSLTLSLEPGKPFRGELAPSVPRPIRNGVVNVNAMEGRFEETYFNHDRWENIGWRDWAPIREDGSFEFLSVPGQQVELIAHCDGFVTTPGGRTGAHYSRPHVYPISSVAQVAMEPAATLAATVVTTAGDKVAGAGVGVAPNVTWGRLGSTYWGQRQRAADYITSGPEVVNSDTTRSLTHLLAQTDLNGLATIGPLPASIAENVSVQHPEFELPPAQTSTNASGRPFREAFAELRSGETTSITLTVVPKGSTTITDKDVPTSRELKFPTFPPENISRPAGSSTEVPDAPITPNLADFTLTGKPGPKPGVNEGAHQIPKEPLLLNACASPRDTREARAATPKEIEVALQRARDAVRMVTDDLPTVRAMLQGRIDGVTSSARANRSPAGLSASRSPNVTMFDYQVTTSGGDEIRATLFPARGKNPGSISWRKTRDGRLYYNVSGCNASTGLPGNIQRPHHSSALDATLDDMVGCDEGRIVMFACLAPDNGLIATRAAWDVTGELKTAAYFQETPTERKAQVPLLKPAQPGDLPPAGSRFISRSDLQFHRMLR